MNATVDQALSATSKSRRRFDPGWTLAEPSALCTVILRLSWLFDGIALVAVLTAAVAFGLCYAGGASDELLMLYVGLRSVGVAAAALLLARLVELTNYFMRRTDPRGDFSRRRSDAALTITAPDDDD